MADNNSLKLPSLTSGENRLKDFDPAVAQRLIDAKADVAKKKIDSEEADKGKGWLGRFFGTKNHSSNNIAGLLIAVLILIGTGYTIAMVCLEYEKTHQQVLDFWNIIVPLITLALGYVFGNRGKEE